MFLCAAHSHTNTVIHINTCSASYSENSKDKGESGETRGKVMDNTAGEHNTKLCVIQTGMTITHGGFQNKSLPFPPLLKLEKKKKNN